MTKWENLTPDDVVTTEDLEEALNNLDTGPDMDALADELEGRVGGADVDSIAEQVAGMIDTHDSDSIERISRQSAVDQLMHLLTEDCDTEACNQARAQLPASLTEHAEQGPDHDHDDDDTETSGSDDGAKDIADDGTDSTDDDGGDDTPTNVFGEPVY